VFAAERPCRDGEELPPGDGYQNLWMLKAHLDEDPEEKTMAEDKNSDSFTRT